MKNFLSLLIITLIFCACATSAKPEVEEFIVNLNSPQISMGDIDAQIDKTFPLPGIKKISVIVSYYPTEDAVCLQYKYDLITYYQFWSKNGRTAFINALAKYKDDYEARSLNNRGGERTKKEYGAVYGYLIWQLSRYTVQARANVNIEIGYSFKSNAPYFTIYQRDTHYEAEYRDNNRDSTPISMYFTRAQADELAVLFDQEYLLGLQSRRNNNIDLYFDENDITTDEY